MKLGILTDLLYKEVNGGRSNTDSSITKGQIKALLPAAVNYALTGDYWGNIAREGDKEVPGAFITVFETNEIYIDERDRDYLYFPQSIANIGGNGGIRFVEDCHGNKYAPRPQGTSKSYWDDILITLMEFEHIGKKIILHNKPPLTDIFFVGVILETSELSDDDEVPMPAGTEIQVIDIMRGFFKGERLNPKDYIINGVDPVGDTTIG